MTSFFDDLEAQLHAAARSQAARHGACRRRWTWRPRPVGGAAALTVAGAAVAVVVAVVALVVGHGHHPGPQAGGGAPSGPQLHQETGYVRAASTAARRTPACEQHRPQVPAATSNGSPSHALLSVLGVLNRPATPADKLPRWLRKNADVRGKYVRYIRRARVKDGISYYIVPAASSSAPLPLSAACSAAMVAALKAELPQIPGQLRAATVALQERLLAADTARRGADSGGVICLMSYSRDVSGGTCGATRSGIEQQGVIASFGPLSGVVPDGVAQVTVRYTASDGRGERSVTSDVVGNVFATSARTARQAASPTMIWRAADGRIIKTVTPSRRSSGGSTSGFCSGKPGSHGC
jgi:hypothetical protein